MIAPRINTRRTDMRLCALVASGVLALSAIGVGQESKQPPEQYTAVAMGTGGAVGGKSISFDFSVTRYNTDAEIDELAALLKSKGQDALRAKLEKMSVGRINAVGRVGNDIAVARKRTDGTDTIITIVTARVMPFMELYNNGRSTDYPFGFLQVKLDKDGKGTGQIMAAAKIRFDKKNDKFEIESFGNQYLKAVNVRPNK
jgi:hypothetical protein